MLLADILLKLENCPRLRIEVRPTALSFNIDPLPWLLTLTFNFMRSMVMTHTQAKDKSQRSLGSKVRMEIDGQTEAIAFSTKMSH